MDQEREDDRLDQARLDRIRAVQGEPYSPQFSPATLWKFNPTAGPAAVPGTLQLKGISGPPQHRFAIINDGTFEPMEKAQVRVGQTNVSLRCLEIREDSVLIQVNGASQTQQLSCPRRLSRDHSVGKEVIATWIFAQDEKGAASISSHGSVSGERRSSCAKRPSKRLTQLNRSGVVSHRAGMAPGLRRTGDQSRPIAIVKTPFMVHIVSAT